jgi:hypothetical protein
MYPTTIPIPGNHHINATRKLESGAAAAAIVNPNSGSRAGSTYGNSVAAPAPIVAYR